jgi:hypothetical protein
VCDTLTTMLRRYGAVGSGVLADVVGGGFGPVDRAVSAMAARWALERMLNLFERLFAERRRPVCRKGPTRSDAYARTGHLQAAPGDRRESAGGAAVPMSAFR